MEFRQANNDGGGGHYNWGHHDRGALTHTLTRSDQWSNLENNWNFVPESCI